MLSILVVIGTKYACNRICLQFRIWDCRHIWSPSRLRLQAYLVTISTEIAGIFGPQRDCFCRHIRSPSWLRLQAYSVPADIVIAGIIGAPDKRFMTFLGFENCCGLLNIFLVQVNSTFLSFFDIWISVLLVGFRSVLTLLVQNQKIPIWPIIRLYLTNIRPVADRPSKYLVGSKTWIS